MNKIQEPRTIINGKRYIVSFVFNMVGNYHFVDKNGLIHLVDGDDVYMWARENGIDIATADGVATAIAYAKELAKENDGIFWWKIKEGYND